VFSRTAGTPTNWVDDVLLNGLTRGTVSGGSNVTKSFPAYAKTRRQILDAVASEGGWEYEVRPDFSINAGTSVWTATPTVVITNKAEGPDGTYTGLLGGLADQSVDASGIATKVIALGKGVGSSIVIGTNSPTPALKTKAGATPTLVQVVSAPAADSANATAIATTIGQAVAIPVVNTTIDTSFTPNYVDSVTGEILAPLVTIGPNGEAGATLIGTDSFDPATVDAINAASEFARMQGGGRAGTSTNAPSAESQFVRRSVRPGDNVYLYDLESGLINTAQQITYRGEVIFPMTKRVLSMTWAIEAGYGVYIRSNAATPVWYDLTPYVQWETPGASMEVGDRPAASYSSTVNRSNPAIEQRVSDPGRVDWTPTVTQGVGITLTVNRGWYSKRSDGTWEAKAKVTCTSAGTAASIIQIGTPFTMANAADVGGTIILLDNGTAFRVGNLGEDTTTTAAMYREGDGGKFSAVTLAPGDILRFTMTGTY
jgi:hypothetical protein